ncbi:MAG TPA: hypothetical protein VLM79_05005 [Kofleriaceae bacterium]|nr:hypothetical protein [Kofleriaceae bacterium]
MTRDLAPLCNVSWPAHHALLLAARLDEVLRDRGRLAVAGSDAGGERAAIAYKILGSCRLAGVDPREYLGRPSAPH